MNYYIEMSLFNIPMILGGGGGGGGERERDFNTMGMLPPLEWLNNK